MKSIGKLREICKYRHLVVNTSMTSDGTTVANLGSPLVETIDDIIGNIEAEIERDYMPKPKIEKCFNAINSGITDISEALQNIAECNAAKCAMRQEVTHADVETMIGSIAAIADAYYMRLPVDADGVPIRPDDLMACTAFDTNDFDGKEHVMAVGNGFWVDKDGCTHIPSETHHVKPRTLEDVLEDYVVEYQTRHARSEFGAEHFDHVDVHEMVKRYADEIRELLGFEIDEPDTIRNELEDNGHIATPCHIGELIIGR